MLPVKRAVTHCCERKVTYFCPSMHFVPLKSPVSQSLQKKTFRWQHKELLPSTLTCITRIMIKFHGIMNVDAEERFRISYLIISYFVQTINSKLIWSFTCWQFRLHLQSSPEAPSAVVADMSYNRQLAGSTDLSEPASFVGLWRSESQMNKVKNIRDILQKTTKKNKHLGD